jgi:hypothetical protein
MAEGESVSPTKILGIRELQSVISMARETINQGESDLTLARLRAIKFAVE